MLENQPSHKSLTNRLRLSAVRASEFDPVLKRFLESRMHELERHGGPIAEFLRRDERWAKTPDHRVLFDVAVTLETREGIEKLLSDPGSPEGQVLNITFPGSSYSGLGLDSANS